MYYEWRRSHIGNEDDTELLLRRMPEPAAGAFVGEGGTILKDIEEYNRQDCESLERIVQWLRRLTSDHGIFYSPHPPLFGPDGENGGSDSTYGNGNDTSSNGSSDDRSSGLPLAKGACGSGSERKAIDSDVIRRGEEVSVYLLQEQCPGGAPLQIRRVLASLIGFHAREGGPARARFGDRLMRASTGDLSSLFYDDQCISLVQFRSVVADSDVGCERGARKTRKRRRSAIYSYDTCESSRIQPSTNCALVHKETTCRERSGNVVDADTDFVRVKNIWNGLVELEFGAKFASEWNANISDEPAPRAGTLVACGDLTICPSAMRASILDSALSAHVQHGSLSPVVTSFLLRRGYATYDPCSPRATPSNVCDVIAGLSGDVFVVQGPPG
jgi:hypothetical protein